MNLNGNVFYSSHVDQELVARLRGAGIMAALVDVRSFRIKSYWNKPKLMLRDGWKLAPNCDPRRTLPREWMIGDAESGQKLRFDRERGRVSLTTFIRGYAQEITFDLTTEQVLNNRVAEPMR